MGYDVNRFKNSDINQEFICGICHDVLKDPLVINPCDHIFCSECINQWIKEKDNCPVDRNKISNQNLHKPLRSFINLLNDLEISCEYSSNGCEQYIKLGGLEVHVNNCNFNPNKFVLCECGLSIDSENLTEHQNNCVKYLRMQLNGTLSIINAMNAKNYQLEKDLKEAKKEISIYNEWDSVDSIEIIATNMSNNMKKKLVEIFKYSLDERTFDPNNLCKKFCEEFGNNWVVFIGNKLIYNYMVCQNLIILKIGRLQILIYMTIKPVNDILILDKMLKILDQGIESKVWNEDMMNTWDLLWNLTDDSLNISERLLDKKIIDYFIQCNHLFPYNEQNLFNPMAGVFANISEFKELRNRLMKQELISVILKMLSNENHLTSYLSSHVLANILSEGKAFWKQYFKHNSVLNRSLIIDELKHKVCEWKISSKFVNFNTFKPFNRLLECKDDIPQEVHYYAVWTLANFTRENRKRYRRLLIVDDCITVLENLIKCSKTEEYVRNLAQLVLYENRLFSENVNRDKLQTGDGN